MDNRGHRFTTILLTVLPVITAALGGAMMVFSSYDDSPGGSLLGFVIIVLSAFWVLKRK
jgi:hypothetical protein